MVKVKEIFWISREALEAIVTITDGCYELECFSQPCTLEINKELEEKIYSFNTKGIMKSSNDKYSIKKQKQNLGYEIVACVEDINNYLIKIGNIMINIEEAVIPNDLSNGDYIDFYTQRLDIY